MRSILLCLSCFCLQASAQVVLRINDSTPSTMTTDALAKLPRQTAVSNEHGKEVSFEGVTMHDVLVQAGVDFGKGLHGKQLSSYVLATGTDGYKVIYSLAEFDPTIVDAGIIIADKREGKPLAATEGPLRIVVPHDKRPTRSLRMLHEIDVVQLDK